MALGGRRTGTPFQFSLHTRVSVWFKHQAILNVTVSTPLMSHCFRWSPRNSSYQKPQNGNEEFTVKDIYRHDLTPRPLQVA